jgi:hypothetical protein
MSSSSLVDLEGSKKLVSGESSFNKSIAFVGDLVGDRGLKGFS